MNSGLQFYSEVVPLDRDQHKDWALRPIKADFTRQAHAVVLLGAEFVEAAREYPIVFVRNGTQVMPVVMLGLRQGENLYVDDSAVWNARYVPAYVRRYPFTFTEVADGQGLFSLDGGYPGLDKEGKEGQRLFDHEGKESDFLKNMLAFVQGFQDDYLRTQHMCTELDKLNLYKENTVQATLPDGTNLSMGGFLVLDEQKLLGLAEDVVTALFKSGMLGTIYAHLISLGNVNALISRLVEREATTPRVTQA